MSDESQLLRFRFLQPISLKTVVWWVASSSWQFAVGFPASKKKALKHDVCLYFSLFLVMFQRNPKPFQTLSERKTRWWFQICFICFMFTPILFSPLFGDIWGNYLFWQAYFPNGLVETTNLPFHQLALQRQEAPGFASLFWKPWKLQDEKQTLHHIVPWIPWYQMGRWVGGEISVG